MLRNLSVSVSTGEVMVWDLGRDDEMLIATSGIGDDSHREPVSKVQWVPDADPKNKKYNVSFSLHIFTFIQYYHEHDEHTLYFFLKFCTYSLLGTLTIVNHFVSLSNW